MAEDNWFSRKQGKKWILVFVILFVNLLIIEGILVGIDSYWGEINYYLAVFIGPEINYVLVLFLLIGVPMVYGLILLILNIRKFIKADRINPHLVHKIFAIAFIIFFDLLLGALIFLFGEEAALVSSLFENVMMFIYLSVFVGLFILLYPILGYLGKLVRHFSKHKHFTGTEKKFFVVIVCISVGYGLGLGLPFFYPPINVITGDLPAKPLVVAHRGASHLAPENTLIAGELAANLSAYGWEIDIQISYDGIPFLMHDDTLKRTTNVSAQFPGRENEPASNFTIDELKQLNAGSWFVERDPYRAIAKGLVTPAQIQQYRNAKIPTLEEAVNLTRDYGLILDADFKGAPVGHPYYATYFNICLNVLKAAGIDSHIIIQTGNRDYLNITQAEAPDMITGLTMSTSNPLSIEEFQAMGYDIANFHHSVPYTVIQAYTSANIPVRVWTVDNIGRFSQLWCANVTFVITNEPHIFVPMIRPLWYLHINTYLIFWLVILLFGLVYVFTLKGSIVKE
ncbi:MAG: glycerophosphodiester phosphodiesterase family protein [Candidatus Helarchaeota archaeon]